MLNDYHLHCEFSDDSIEPMENQVERGIEIGLNEMCFTDHVDYGIKKDWSEGNIEYRGGDGIPGSPNRGQPLANVDYPRYFEKLDKMREKYGDRITIKKGLEFGVQTITQDKFEKLYSAYSHQLDFVLLSMHQVDNKEFWTQDFQKGHSQKEYNEMYYEEILKVVKAYKNYSVLAHLDLLARYDEAGIYPFEKVRDIIAEILKIAISDGKGIEINTSSWHYGLKDTQPSRAILKLYKDLGGKIVTIGSDAHSTRFLGDHIKDAQDILKNEIGISQIAVYTGMEPELVKI